MKTLAKSAKIIEVLVDYDGPQLILSKTDRGYHMLSVAIAADTMDEPFFGCEINDKIYDGYFEQTWDLHYAFRHAIGHCYYNFDLAKASGDEIALKKVAPDKSFEESQWPRVGFFSRSHTTLFNLESRPWWRRAAF